MSDGSVTDQQAHAWLADIAEAAYISLHFDNRASVGRTGPRSAGVAICALRWP